ncbi:MAG: hypothetical protein KME22_09145 [Hassallia sp. WJT32-NPBG1]|jgi:predicted metal-dependent HD superfamily phosphohydrolase|nr:hypothetical protein [Hassallia sp. WJT32-NPBG1]
MPKENLTDILFCSWQHTLSSFEVDQVAAEKAFNLLVEAYSSSDRYYHTLKHILVSLGSLSAIAQGYFPLHFPRNGKYSKTGCSLAI